MKKNIAIIILALLLIAAAVWYFFIREKVVNPKMTLGMVDTVVKQVNKPAIVKTAPDTITVTDANNKNMYNSQVKAYTGSSGSGASGGTEIHPV